MKPDLSSSEYRQDSAAELHVVGTCTLKSSQTAMDMFCTEGLTQLVCSSELVQQASLCEARSMAG